MEVLIVIAAAFGVSNALVKRSVPSQTQSRTHFPCPSPCLTLVVFSYIDLFLSACASVLRYSGAAKLLAQALLAAAEPTGVTGLYIMVYLATTLFTASVTNNAAVTIMFPVAFEAALDAEVPARFITAIEHFVE